VRREGNRIFVRGLDFFDGTPIVDIKSYRISIGPTISRCPSGFANWPIQKGHVQFSGTNAPRGFLRLWRSTPYIVRIATAAGMTIALSSNHAQTKVARERR